VRSCEDFEKLLPAYVAGIADPTDVAEIGEHLGDCEPCMNDFQRVVKDLGTLKSWREPVPPEGLSARILEQLVSEEERKRREALGEETSWGEPVQRALTWAVLGALGVVMLATLVTAQSGSRHEARRRACADNLKRIGEIAVERKRFIAPLGDKALKDVLIASHADLLLCPVAGALPEYADDSLPAEKRPPIWSSYRMNLRGPRYLAGDERANHRWIDGNILMNDGSVITVTPAQGGLWELLDPYSPGR
jgi:hypothetical protein